jgi:predicted metal-dependent hydrolase
LGGKEGLPLDPERFGCCLRRRIRKDLIRFEREESMIEYTLIRSKRRTMAIHIKKDITLEVRAPLKTPKAEIDRFVMSKRNWIEKHLAAIAQQADNRARFSIRYNDTLSLQGREYPIIAKEGKRAGFDDQCFFLPPALPPDEIKRVIIQVYRAVAKEILANKVNDYSKQMGVMPAAVKVNSAKTRWGSCSGKNIINFSWRLVMADDDVINYVVVHELAHIREHNHSERFWRVVASVLPDYERRRKKLKEFQRKLANEDWD